MTPEKDIPELKVVRSIDQKTGRVESKYYWLGKQIPKVLLSGDIAEQYSGLTLIAKDLGNALKWAKKARSLLKDAEANEGKIGSKFIAKDRELFDEVKGLYVAALTFYAKAYTEADGRRAQMSRDWLDQNFHEAHTHTMMVRHNFAAHSGDEKLEISKSYLLLIEDSKSQLVRLTSTRIQPDFIADQDDMDSFSKLIEHAISVVDARAEKMGKKIIESAMTRDFNFWKKASKKNMGVDIDRVVKNHKK